VRLSARVSSESLYPRSLFPQILPYQIPRRSPREENLDWLPQLKAKACTSVIANVIDWNFEAIR
jgi:hypothetical protein